MGGPELTGVAGPTIVARGLTAGYGPSRRNPDVLRGLDLEVRPGEVTAVVGPNGAGKSTLFRAVMGLLPPRTGRVTVGDRSPVEHRRRHGFGYLPESVVLPRGWTALEWVRAGARLKGPGGSRTDGAASDLLGAMGLGAHRDTRLGRLSRGTIRRVALAWVLAGSPGVVLLDEPLAALDAPARVRVREVVEGLRRRGATVLEATHELTEVPRLADRALVITGGRIIAELDRPDPAEMEARIMAASEAS